jgi:uncharacterized protein YjbI with pentapeptide repeats
MKDNTMKHNWDAAAQTQLNRWWQRICCGVLCVSLWLLAGLAPQGNAAWALDYKQENLMNADFAGRDLRDANFTKANLQRSNFNHANLSGVRLFAANLEGADFEGADLQFAILDQARLRGTNLSNANLTGAFAYSAQFRGVIINGADFTDAEMRPEDQELLCQIAEGKNPVTGKETRASLDCN